jgi:Domain of unknown function (DUF4861)
MIRPRLCFAMMCTAMMCTALGCLPAAEAPTLPSLIGLAAVPSTFCRYVPEREDDFAWENDHIAFRVYGPAAVVLKRAEDSGIDCWPKRVSYPIINRWYAGAQHGLNYHDDRGEGGDQYHVGRSRGCGGTGLWVNEQMVLPGPYVDWHVDACGRERTAFTLTYRYPAAGGEEPVVETKSVEILLGEDWFTATSTFTRGGKPLAGQPVVAGVTTHDGKGTATFDPAGRWLAVWEDIPAQGLGSFGTGIALPAGAELRLVGSPKTPDTSHAVAILKTDGEGRLRLRAGYAWPKAGRITTLEAWQQTLAAAAQKL